MKGLTQTLAKEGDKSNIKVNCIAPIAASRMTETVLPKSYLELLDPAYVTPMVTYLAGETCKSNGAAFELVCCISYIAQIRAISILCFPCLLL